jgi:hypothetical protein
MAKSDRILVLVPEPYHAKLLLPLTDALKAKVIVATEWNWSDFFFQPIEDFNPTAILIWNGLAQQTISATKVLRRRYPVGILEMGWLPQNGHMYCLDAPAAESRLASVDYFDIKSDITSIKALYTPSPVALPERFVFVPMQLEHDTSMLFSHDHKLMDKFLAYVSSATKLPVVVRNHPKAPDVPRHAIVSKEPANDIAAAATMVVGINSTVLIEALIHHKPVVYHGGTVGQEAMWDGRAFYGTSLDRVLELKQFSKEEMNFRIALLTRNQFEIANPPGWILDKIRAADFGPRLFDS